MKKLFLGTMPTAAPGAYIVAVSPAQATDSITTSASQATTGYMLDPAAPLRKVEPDSSATNITVPASISPLEGLRTYLLLVGR